MNILEYVDTLIEQGYTEEEAYLFADLEIETGGFDYDN